MCFWRVVHFGVHLEHAAFHCVQSNWEIVSNACESVPSKPNWSLIFGPFSIMHISEVCVAGADFCWKFSITWPLNICLILKISQRIIFAAFANIPSILESASHAWFKAGSIIHEHQEHFFAFILCLQVRYCSKNAFLKPCVQLPILST